MNKYTVGDAIRMVGHLLEHHGIVGPYWVNSEGTDQPEPTAQTSGFCMAGACIVVEQALGLGTAGSWGTVVSNPIERKYGNQRVSLWEGTSNRTTAEQRLQLARELQNWKD